VGLLFLRGERGRQGSLFTIYEALSHQSEQNQNRPGSYSVAQILPVENQSQYQPNQ